MLALPFLAQAQCVAVSTINDSFESYQAGTGQGMPTCWASAGTSGPVIGVRNGSGEARTGSNYVQVYSFFSTNPTNYFVTPELTAINGSGYAKFYLKSDDAAAMTVTYGTMESQTNTGSFNELGTIALVDNQYVEVNTGTIPATSHKYFAIKIVISGMHKTIKLDDFEWGILAVPCDEVTNLVSSNITKNSVKIAWKAQTENQFKVEYGIAGFTQGNGTIQTVTTNQIDLTNLNEDTNYDVYVTTVCGAETSENAVKLSFKTLNTLAVNLSERKSLFTVYPNPSNGTTISLTTEEDLSDYNYAIYSVAGQLLVENTLSPTINISQLENGTYLLVIQSNSNSYVHQIIIQK